MASRVNHEANYLYSIDAITPWEKMRVIRNFLLERTEQLETIKLDLQLAEYKIKILASSEKFEDQIESKKLTLNLPTIMDIIQKTTEEVAFLRKYHDKLKIDCEPTRVIGKTDEEMFELNYEAELTQKYIQMLKSDLIAYGRPSTEVTKALLKMPPLFDECVRIGIVSKDALRIGTSEQQNLLESSITDIK